jgi:hypothetical protein
MIDSSKIAQSSSGALLPSGLVMRSCRFVRASTRSGMSLGRTLGPAQSQAGGQSSAATGSLAGHPEVEHPLVLTHPVTGARSLLLGSMVIPCITGLSETVSRALLDDLLEHTTSEPYSYSHRWSQGDLVVWDNLATLHTPPRATVPATADCCIALLFDGPQLRVAPTDDRRREREDGPCRRP